MGCYQSVSYGTAFEEDPLIDDICSTASDDGIKVVLLGSGETGKSTIFKRIALECGKGFDTADKAQYVRPIHENVIESMKILVANQMLQSDRTGFKLKEENKRFAKMIEAIDYDETLSTKLAKAIKSLWNDPSIQRIWAKRSHYQIPDTADYFFSRIDALVKKDYIPSGDDILRCRDRTTGIHKESLEIDKIDYVCIDVGGQTSERSIWVEVFRDIKAVIYLVSLSEYDQLMFEDEKTNRLEDSLLTWDIVVNRKRFEQDAVIPFVLIFNKTDLFREKLELGQSRFSFEGYDGPQQYEAIRKYLIQKFTAKNSQSLPMKTFFMCALSDDIHCVFDAFREYFDCGWD